MLIQGSCVVEELLTREEAARKLQPSVGIRQFQKYLDLASLELLHKYFMV
ncbi:hypothetical protein GXM_09442 [Nostoc sphaeroides CCNUC1]|uniref:Uncharacterized protein n=1 Tax=Nostoc sphaeroides CCNUC1 TaxID=2653204 RepID=A0A5P8WGP7_9NOSO|nr:hypothetical protein GXM_09442 [Nostoc sphaeroides CCNUC1]